MNPIILLFAIMLQVELQPDYPPRSIILFGNKQAAEVTEQWELLKGDSSGLAERDVKLTWVKPGSPLYKKYAIDAGNPITVILVGRDGEEKYRSNKITASSHFFALIDAMPMRKAEMKKDKKNLQ